MGTLSVTPLISCGLKSGLSHKLLQFTTSSTPHFLHSLSLASKLSISIIHRSAAFSVQKISCVPHQLLATPQFDCTHTQKHNLSQLSARPATGAFLWVIVAAAAAVCWRWACTDKHPALHAVLSQPVMQSSESIRVGCCTAPACLTHVPRTALTCVRPTEQSAARIHQRAAALCVSPPQQVCTSAVVCVHGTSGAGPAPFGYSRGLEGSA